LYSISAGKALPEGGRGNYGIILVPKAVKSDLIICVVFEVRLQGLENLHTRCWT